MTAVVETPFPTVPGVYPDIPEDRYHAHRGSLSSTGARTLAHKTPAHFAYERMHGGQHKAQFDLGSAVHSVVLGRGADLELLDFDTYNTKASKEAKAKAYAAGKIPLLTDQAEAVEQMVAAVRAHSVAGKLFARTDCQPEVTVVGEDPETGVLCRARFDWLLPIKPGQPVRFVDLKTGTDASPHGMAKSVNDWNYAAQFDFYETCLRWALNLPDEVPVLGTLVFVEKDPPHLIGIGQPDEQAIAWAHEDNRRARHIYRRCTESGQWPGYDDAIVPLSLPGWRLAAYESQYPMGEYRPEDDFGEWS